MRTIRSLLAAMLAIIMVLTMSVSAFAVYENLTYEDVSELFSTTLSNSALLQIKFADSLGIVSGLKNGTFLPEAKVTRGEALKIAYRMLHYDYDELDQYNEATTPFDDSEGGDISDVATIRPYVAWAMDYQLINSEYVPESQFQPDTYITGEEFITLIKKVYGMVEKAYEQYFSEVDEHGDPIPGFYEYSDFADLEYYFEDAVFSLAEISADSETVNREQAAVAVANAMLFDPELGYVSDDMFTFFEKDEGVALECMATEIYGCDYIDLFVRATKEIPLDYENVTGDALLSNGVQIETGMDMSSFIGFPVVVLYFDKDGSETYTENEEMFGYELQSPMVYTMSLSDLTVAGNVNISGTDGTDSFALYSNVPHYLNGGPWPTDKSYSLYNMLGEGDPAVAQTVLTRPNLEFTFIKSGSSTNSDLVLATEWIPGRVMMANEKYISVYSYYNDEIYIYEDSKAVYHGTSTLTGGDFVNFYEANGKIHISNGVTVELKAPVETVDATTGVKSIVVGETTYLRHIYFNNASKPLSGFEGKVTAILDKTGKSYIAFEEARATKEDTVKILSANANADGVTATITAVSVTTGKELTLEKVEIDRISSATGEMNEGDLFTYYKTVDGKINMDGVDPETMYVIETEDYFITDGGVKYLKAEGYQAGDEAVKGEVTLLIDHNKCVWAVA